MLKADAILEDTDGRPALRFERLLEHPPERVWESLTDPEKQAAWHPTPARIEAAVGGRVEYLEGGSARGMSDGEVTEYDPPRLLAYSWGSAENDNADQLRWELRPHDDGCLLVLVHSFDDRLKAARDGAGWHLCLDSLAQDLDGGSPGGVPDGSEPSWAQLNGVYQERFGISPEEATPPPPRN
jgi:uncharacterized protein YndB with AHSA1/START domain